MKPKIFMSVPQEEFPNYVDALELAGAEIGRCPLESDGLLLPGGGDLDPSFYGQEDVGCTNMDPERDRRELELCQQFLSAKKPILGICRGAQVLAVALGGTLIQQIEHHSGLPNGADRLHETRTAGILTGLYGPYCTVNSWHHQAVGQLPPDCRILQISDDGVIEAFCHNTLPVLAVQWHPERLCGRFARPDAANGLLLFRYFLTLCPEGNL